MSNGAWLKCPLQLLTFWVERSLLEPLWSTVEPHPVSVAHAHTGRQTQRHTHTQTHTLPFSHFSPRCCDKKKAKIGRRDYKKRLKSLHQRGKWGQEKIDGEAAGKVRRKKTCERLFFWQLHFFLSPAYPVCWTRRRGWGWWWTAPWRWWCSCQRCSGTAAWPPGCGAAVCSSGRPDRRHPDPPLGARRSARRDTDAHAWHTAGSPSYHEMIPGHDAAAAQRSLRGWVGGGGQVFLPLGCDNQWETY